MQRLTRLTERQLAALRRIANELSWCLANRIALRPAPGLLQLGLPGRDAGAQLADFGDEQALNWLRATARRSAGRHGRSRADVRRLQGGRDIRAGIARCRR